MNQQKWMPIVVLFAAAGTSQAAAATVRGKLLQGNSPASGIQVTVLNQQKVRTSPVYSGANGMYYIPNVKAGSYTLEVWTTSRKSPLVFPIQVKEPESDINPIKLP
jgi:hypothetical protein